MNSLFFVNFYLLNNTATLKQGFIGCLRDLMLTNKPVDIAAFARQQDSGETLCLHFTLYNKG